MLTYCCLLNRLSATSWAVFVKGIEVGVDSLCVLRVLQSENGSKYIDGSGWLCDERGRYNLSDIASGAQRVLFFLQRIYVVVKT